MNTYLLTRFYFFLIYSKSKSIFECLQRSFVLGPRAREAEKKRKLYRLADLKVGKQTGKIQFMWSMLSGDKCYEDAKKYGKEGGNC